MTCGIRYAEADDFKIICDSCDTADPVIKALLEASLDAAAGEIGVNMQSAGMCDCTLSLAAENYLKRLNLIAAAVIRTCPCYPLFREDERANMLIYVNEQMNLLRTGAIELCDGVTGSNYPAFGWSENNATEWSETEIIRHTWQRTS